MREILFRGKDIKENWHIGLLAHLGNAWYIANKAGIATAFEVIPETVGQYTGLTDKNGKKIFEGDICSKFSNYSGKRLNKPIVFEDGLFYMKYGEEAGMPLCDVYEKVEVIGNIHDNPELLKEGAIKVGNEIDLCPTHKEVFIKHKE